MNSKLFKIFFFFFLLNACSVKKEEVTVPKSILSNEELTAILTECYLVESAYGLNVKMAPGQFMDSIYMFNPVKDHKCSKGKFDSSLLFYSQHPIILKQIYDTVLERLNKIQAKGKYD